ncbi:MAG: hypothetical protein Q4B78_05200 [Bacillota bacterium]|nr:hypothetical protein [Bacillota bacterium]
MNENGYFGGEGLWIFALLILMFMGGFGGLNGNNAIGYENLATSNEVQRGFDNQNAMANQRDILSAVTNGTAQSVAATNQAKYDNINVAKDIQNELDREISELQLGQSNLMSKYQEGHCDTIRAIEGVKYEGALNTASINSNIDAKFAAMEKSQLEARIAEQAAKINQLEISKQFCGIPRINSDAWGVFPYAIAPWGAPPMPPMQPNI